MNIDIKTNIDNILNIIVKNKDNISIDDYNAVITSSKNINNIIYDYDNICKVLHEENMKKIKLYENKIEELLINIDHINNKKIENNNKCFYLF
jgi:hypothetical protein